MEHSANQEEAYAISVVGLSKAFPHVTSDNSADEFVLRDFSFVVPRGQLCSVFGPNGCGKSTLLGILSGLIPCDSGTVVIGGAPPKGGATSCVFQHFQDSLFPWRTVRGNLLFPLECRHSPKSGQDAALAAFLSDFSFPFSLHSRTYELSAGQQQMVCIARALISSPRILLLDEPFSALDFRLRRLMQDLLLKYWEKRRPTILLVTHDIDEALFLGQRLLVLPPKPVTCYHDVVNDLPKDRSVMFTQPFANLRAQALSFLEKENSAN